MPEVKQGWSSAACVVGFALAMGSGCMPLVRPFTDELQGSPRVTTPSVETVQAEATTPRVATRDFEESQRAPVSGAVSHTPLYFEDPYEADSNPDDHFAWDAKDYWQLVYWRGRFLVNAVIFPVVAVLNPPWRVMESDGVPGPRMFGEMHDAARIDPEANGKGAGG